MGKFVRVFVCTLYIATLAAGVRYACFLEKRTRLKESLPPGVTLASTVQHLDAFPIDSAEPTWVKSFLRSVFHLNRNKSALPGPIPVGGGTRIYQNGPMPLAEALTRLGAYGKNGKLYDETGSEIAVIIALSPFESKEKARAWEAKWESARRDHYVVVVDP